MVMIGRALATGTVALVLVGGIATAFGAPVAGPIVSGPGPGTDDCTWGPDMMDPNCWAPGDHGYGDHGDWDHGMMGPGMMGPGMMGPGPWGNYQHA